MSPHISWTTPLMVAEDAVKRAGILFEDKKTREAMIEITKAQIALAEVAAWALTNRA